MISSSLRFIAALVAVCASITMDEGLAAPLIESRDFSFSEIEAMGAFDIVNFSARYRVAQTPDKVREMVIDAFKQALIAKEAERIGLTDMSKNNARLQRVRDVELARIAIDYKRQELRAKLPDFSKQAQEIYRANLGEFTSQEQVDVGHVLFRIKPCETSESLRAKAQAFRERLHKGESFEDLAKVISDDKGSASSGGRLGFQERQTFVPAFGEAAFALKEPGEISDIVETQAGLHVVKLYARKPAEKQLFEDVAPSIIERLERDYLQREIDQWRHSLWDAKETRVNDQAIEDFTKNLQDSLPKIEFPGFDSSTK